MATSSPCISSRVAFASAPRTLPVRPFTTRYTSQRAIIRCQAEEATPSSSAADPTPKPSDACPTCGVPRSEMSFGCDGSGRIMGGIGAVPGFGWWPIKAYRPCGKANERGIRYQRKGQVVDEVLFGRSDK